MRWLAIALLVAACHNSTNDPPATPPSSPSGPTTPTATPDAAPPATPPAMPDAATPNSPPPPDAAAPPHNPPPPDAATSANPPDASADEAIACTADADCPRLACGPCKANDVVTKHYVNIECFRNPCPKVRAHCVDHVCKVAP